MSEEQPIEPLRIDIPNTELFQFASPDELLKWNGEEREAWQWISAAQPFTQDLLNSHQNFFNSISSQTNEWKQNLNRPQYLQNPRQAIVSTFTAFYGPPNILWRTAPAAEFLNQIRAKRGDVVAAGAYRFLVNKAQPSSNLPSPEFLEGLLNAFVFQQEVDWTATAHQESLNRLRHQYTGNISDQKARLKEIETANKTLNERFSVELEERGSALSKLHNDQSSEFTAMTQKNEETLKSIEETYDQKLALQKPVAYWETKEKYHASLSKKFAVASAITAAALITLIVLLVHCLFADLKPGQDPKYWEIGIFATAAFFSIWVVRILLRLFFSNIHLSSDAAERRTMVLTYLALAREGSDVGPEEKKLILQHLFRAASDGLVKDEAAPPSFLEYFTRR